MRIATGRQFTKKPGSQVYIQCRFNGEILATDPVELAASPIWDTELAWDVDSKVLGFLRSQRATLKLIVYALDPQKRRDSLGYIMLDLRAASQATPVPEKWMSLINVKTSNSLFKPELKVSFTVVSKGEARLGPGNPTVSSTNPVLIERPPSGASPVKRGYSAAVTFADSQDGRQKSASASLDPSQTSVPIKLNDEGFYHIGSGIEVWTLWITIAFAEHLLQLSSPLETASNSSFYFYYSFLGNEITTQKFYNLSQPNFPAERVSIRLKASPADLQTFMAESGKLIVYLCQDNKVLGFSHVLLSDLLQQSGTDLRVMENVYPLLNQQQDLVVSDDGKAPSIGLSLALAHEKQVTVQAKQKESIAPSPKSQIPKPKASAPLTVENKTSATEIPSKNPLTSAPVNVLPPVGNANLGRPPLPQRFVRPEMESTVPHLGDSLPGKWHQYRFSIDLRSIRDFQPKSGNVFFKYSYAPFGTSSPTITHPPCEVLRSGHDAVLPHSFCAFEFVMSPERLRTYLDAVPLVIEMWHRDTFSKDVPIGMCTIHLSAIFEQKAKTVTEPQYATIYGQDTSYPITASGHEEETYKKVADLRVVTALEDFGPLEEEFHEVQENPNLVDTVPTRTGQTAATKAQAAREKAFAFEYATQAQTMPTSGPDFTPIWAPRVPKSDAGIPIHDTPEYKVALELEIYRQEEEAKFREHLKARESEFLSQLANEWKKREKEREASLKKKTDEIYLLETQFQNLIMDLESREKKLDQGENDLVNRRQDVERELERRIEEARDATRRLQEEFKHRIELEKQKASDIEGQKLRLVKERDDLEHRLRTIETEFSDFKRSLGTTTEAQLRAELNTMMQAKSELERQVLTLTQSKKHYKTEWMKAIANLAKTKKDMQADQEASNLREKRDLQRLKIQFMAKEEKDLVASDRQVIQGLRQQLEEIKNAGFDGYRSVRQAYADPQKHGAAPAAVPQQQAKENMDPHRVAEIERLTNERDSLLRTGAYSHDDRLIRDLSTRISQLLM